VLFLVFTWRCSFALSLEVMISCPYCHSTLDSNVLECASLSCPYCDMVLDEIALGRRLLKRESPPQEGGNTSTRAMSAWALYVLIALALVLLAIVLFPYVILSLAGPMPSLG